MSGLSELLDDLKDLKAEQKAERVAYQKRLKEEGKPTTDLLVTKMMAVEFQLQKSTERVWTEISRKEENKPPTDEKDEALPSMCPKCRAEFDKALEAVLMKNLTCLDCYAKSQEKRGEEFEQPDLKELAKAEKKLDELRKEDG